MRPRTACTTCRRRQRRCIIDAFGAACEYCTKNRLPCSLSTSERGESSEGRSLTQRTQSLPTTERPRLEEAEFSGRLPEQPVQLPPRDVCLEIASAYFTYIHDPSHHLFHKTTFIEDVGNEKLPKSILLCVLALAARFSTSIYFNGIDPRARGDIYVREAERLLDLHDISLSTLHTAILLGSYYGADGDSMHEILYYTIACRMSSLLNVPNMTRSTALDKELEIRLWWTLVMIDVWSSNAAQLPRLLLPRDDIPYPLAENLFSTMSQAAASHGLQTLGPSLQEQYSTSILAETIKLNSILAEIAQLNKGSADRSLSNSEIRINTDALAEKLANWVYQVPPWLMDTHENLALHASSGVGGAFVALHLGYYHFAQLLYYRFLHLPAIADDVGNLSTAVAELYAERCRINSTALCETLYSAYNTPGAEVYYSMVGHVLVIASTVQLHILLFSGNDIEIRAARQRLERNFRILCKLQTLWRGLDISFDRFRSFHDACMKSKQNTGDPGSEFRLDKWMVGFLMEFSKPIAERPDEAFAEDNSVSFAGSETYTEDIGDIDDDYGFDLHQWSVDTFGIDFEM